MDNPDTNIPLLNDDSLSPSDDSDQINWKYQKETCRICLDEDQSKNLLAPCRCSGSSKYVHVDCLNEWRATSNNPEAFNRCFTCNYTYQTRVTQQELGYCGKFNFGLPRYYCGIYIINFIIIFALGIFLQMIDPNQDIPKFFNKYLNPFEIVGDHNNQSTADFFDYYAVGSYIYMLIIFFVFIVALIRIKNRKLYLKYLLGGPWYFALCRLITFILLTALCLTTNAIIGCFVMTCLIQAVVRHHYNYLNHLYRASESVILPYNPVGDHQRVDDQV